MRMSDGNYREEAFYYREQLHKAQKLIRKQQNALDKCKELISHTTSLSDLKKLVECWDALIELENDGKNL